MSLFEEATVSCPGCFRVLSFEVCNSVNADRRPDLREDILSGTFQHLRCQACDTVVALPPLLTYLDIGRSQWLLAKPAGDYPDWAALETIARETFSGSFGASAPAPARTLGQRLRPRIVFGWAALREKLLAAEHGIDDVSLELLKLAIIRNGTGFVLGDDNELRLVGVEDGMLAMRWCVSRNEQTIASMSIPAAALDDLAADEAAWAPLRDRLTQAFFVDFGRLLLADG